MDGAPHLFVVPKPSAEVVDIHRGCFVRELLDREPQPAQPAERYTLRAWADGYRIYDGWTAIATFHGAENFDLAARLLRLLKADDQPPPQAA